MDPTRVDPQTVKHLGVVPNSELLKISLLVGPQVSRQGNRQSISKQLEPDAVLME